ncbi:Mu transposase C-terminal domain-containing protein [Deinococcus soli (ex Cha et al. 2016)]|uniref:Mu transposase C-terminal domain-containing protein n=1 Tax=Deinococcus soli (ex Cha et al. 2016) TaxID=1309411 RepID=UPI00166E08AC|nr:Mu transposase C-terminal domain-containing protein [Deinococcus soli (ex Cha et al. 2016)]GGB84705.1 hypothetical protein GCM10008019_45860 [Deinococcus soli (ex Cha et al. 2016)]
MHSTLQSTPLKVWQSAPNPALTYIPPTDSLLIDVLPQLNVGRQVHPFGVTVHNIKYWDDSLIPLIGRPDKYVVKYDPNNLSSIWLLHETTYIRVRYRDLAYPDVSLKEFQQARKALRAQGHDASDTDAVMAFYERSSARTAASREATQAARHAPAPASISTTEQEAPSSGDRRAWLAAPRSPLED